MSSPVFEREGKPRVVAVIAWVIVLLGVYTSLGAVVLSVPYSIEILLHSEQPGQAGSDWLESLRSTMRQQGPWILAVSSLLQWLIFLGGSIWGYTYLHQRSLLINSRLLEIRPRGMLVAALTALSVVPLALYLGEIWFWIFPQLEFLKELDPLGALDYGEPEKWVLYFFAIGLTPAVCEEMLFRGYLQQTLRRVWSPQKTILFSGVFFALIHMNALGLFALLPVGLLIAFFYDRFQSLPVSMVFHFTYNSALVLLSTPPLAEFVESLGQWQGIFVLGSLFIVVILLGVVLLSFRAPCHFERSEKS